MKSSCRCGSVDKFWPRADGTSLLDTAAGSEDLLLAEHGSHDLQPGGQTFDKSARYRGRRLTGEVERPSQWRPIEPLGEVRCVGGIDADSKGGDRNGRRQQKIVVQMKQQRSALLLFFHYERTIYSRRRTRRGLRLRKWGCPIYASALRSIRECPTALPLTPTRSCRAACWSRRRRRG
jgi:hypothetical protein